MKNDAKKVKQNMTIVQNWKGGLLGIQNSPRNLTKTTNIFAILKQKENSIHIETVCFNIPQFSIENIKKVNKYPNIVGDKIRNDFTANKYIA